jgi:hypothetical protein
MILTKPSARGVLMAHAVPPQAVGGWRPITRPLAGA